MYKKIPIYTSVGRVFISAKLYAEKFESVEKFIKILDEKIDYNSDKRIAGRLKEKSPVQYRTLFFF